MFNQDIQPGADSDNPIREADYGLMYKLFGLLGIPLGLCIIGAAPQEATSPGIWGNERLFLTLGGAVFLTLAVTTLIGSWLGKITWDEAGNLFYRDSNLRKVSANLSDLEDLDFKELLSLVKVTFNNAPTCYYSPQINNVEALGEFVLEGYGKVYPHRAMGAGSRYELSTSEMAGCTVCLHTYPVAAITQFQQQSPHETSPEDLAICPICQNFEEVMCDNSKGLMSRDNLIKLEAEVTPVVHPIAAAEHKARVEKAIAEGHRS